MTIGLLCGAGTHNVGDELMLDTLTARLRADLGADVAYLTYGVKRNHPERGIRSLWADARGALAGVDVLLVGPGGVFPGLAQQEYWAPVEAHFANGGLRKLGVGLGYTPGAAMGDDAEPRTRAWMEQLEWTWARDTVLAGMIPRGGAFPDVAYLAAPELLTMRVPVGERSGVLLVPCSDTGNLRRRLSRAIAWHVEDGETVTALPATGAEGADDRRLCEEMARDCGLSVCSDVLPWREFAERVARCRLLITARAHPAIMADMLGVPYVSVDPWDKLLPIAAVSGATGDARPAEAVLGAHTRALAGWAELARRIMHREPHTYHDGSHLP